MKRPKIPPTTVYLPRFKRCWGCNGLATVAVRLLTLRNHRFYCYRCSRTLEGVAGGGSPEWSMTGGRLRPAGPSMAEFRSDAPSLKPEHRKALARAAAALPPDWRVSVQPVHQFGLREFVVRVRSGDSLAIKGFDEAEMVEAVRFIESFAPKT